MSFFRPKLMTSFLGLLLQVQPISSQIVAFSCVEIFPQVLHKHKIHLQDPEHLKTLFAHQSIKPIFESINIFLRHSSFFLAVGQSFLESSSLLVRGKSQKKRQKCYRNYQGVADLIKL